MTFGQLESSCCASSGKIYTSLQNFVKKKVCLGLGLAGAHKKIKNFLIHEIIIKIYFLQGFLFSSSKLAKLTIGPIQSLSR
jgi:hypothetical protein